MDVGSTVVEVCHDLVVVAQLWDGPQIPIGFSHKGFLLHLLYHTSVAFLEVGGELQGYPEGGLLALEAIVCLTLALAEALVPLLAYILGTPGVFE